MLSDEWLPRYRLLENFTAKWNGNGNAYDRGDYNSSFALRAVELKTKCIFLTFYASEVFIVIKCQNNLRFVDSGKVCNPHKSKAWCRQLIQ